MIPSIFSEEIPRSNGGFSICYFEKKIKYVMDNVVGFL